MFFYEISKNWHKVEKKSQIFYHLVFLVQCTYFVQFHFIYYFLVQSQIIFVNNELYRTNIRMPISVVT